MMIHPCLVKVGYIVITHNKIYKLRQNILQIQAKAERTCYSSMFCLGDVIVIHRLPGKRRGHLEVFFFFTYIGIFFHIHLIIHLDILSDQQKLNPSSYCLCKKCCWMDTVEESFCCLSKYKKSVEGYFFLFTYPYL